MKASALQRFLMAGALALTVGSAHAAWPDDRPIELVVGFAPGGGTDVMARLVAQHMEKRLGDKARIIVVNKPGAGGEIAVRYVAAAKPDGYTLGMINAPGFVYLPVSKGAKYKPEDIRLIARLVDDPLLFIKRRGSNAPDDLTQLVAKLKQTPESLSFGHSGDGTTGHLALMDMERSQSVKGNSVPFKGGGDIRLGVLGDHIDYGLITVTEVPELNDPKGPFQAIAITSDKRHNDTIPTAAESGIALRYSSERGMGGPATLPDAIRDKLEQALQDMLKDPAFLAASGRDAQVLAFQPGDEWKASLDRQTRAFQDEAAARK
ncbi:MULTISPECIES: tripartite tricarboxylate transporter substrate binding protein [Achromobacter]|uniref:Tripartite tricarboxylate transporter substrate binding protein n=1 Tax=Achromobacter spanius TaxID=217203 RepID=A0ABY8GWK7_9BURK|nr:MULTISPECIES: tripartite tricarboxylate transporter substrate binding protein [Achromobacter]WAI81531.1 tripartite tricarboxylate transporter substrate binding protein [Achromobacter spanius]WEX97048.1 tripartite tricarboxylate transporter substrate binding protein [Achromobacter sp. SS2-2022]WFP09235.1 tripartite tricarboxylate transporter substrate binding protein [Achromobacter spanius]